MLSAIWTPLRDASAALIQFSPPAETLRWIGAVLFLTLSLWQVMPSGVLPGRSRRLFVIVSGLLGLGLLWWSIPAIGSLSARAGFWGLGALTVSSAVATISARSPVYSAVWFALSLLGTAALFFLQGAQFLGVATVAVYAGAIVVTFLFVLMLAQPEGHAFYDRISWGTTPRFVGALTAVLFAILVSMSMANSDEVVRDERVARIEQLNSLLTELPGVRVRAVRFEDRGDAIAARVAVGVPVAERAAWAALRDPFAELARAQLQAGHPDWKLQEIEVVAQDVLTTDHTATLGGQIFGRHLVVVQAGGTLLLAALVGAVAIASRGGALGRDQESR